MSEQEIGRDPGFKYRYEFYPALQLGNASDIHIWVVECAKGAVHLSIRHHRALGEVHGGIEFHYRTPPSIMGNHAPDTHNCRFTGGICWHDGSSSAADDAVQVFAAGERLDHDWFFRECESHVRELIQEPTS